MKRVLLVSLSVVVLGWMAGCGGGGSSNPGGGTPQTNAFNGQYAFVLSGFDANGNSLGIAGSLKADGLGHISAGEVDVNDNGTVSSSSSVAGTYAFDANGNSTLGTISLTNAVGSVTHPLAFAFSLQASGAFGQIMSLDQNGFDAGGTIQLQSSSAFTLAGLAGDFVVTVNGRNGSNPTSALGRFTLASTGATSNIEFDRSVAGSTAGTAGPTTGASAVVTFAGTGPDANGRGTLTLTLNDAIVSGTQNFAYYAVSAKRIVAVETDATGTMTADFASQTIPATVNTTGSVFGMAGVDTAASDEITAVGQLQMTGIGATAGTLNWDANDAGAIHSGIALPSQAVAYDSTTGRGTVTVTGGNASGLGDTLVFYLSGAGSGFILDATTGTSNRAMAGPLSAQATGPFSAATDLSGLGIVRSRASSVNDAFSLVGLFGLTSGQTTYELVFDDNSGFGANATVQGPDFIASGIGLGTLDGTVGRGTLSVPNGGGGVSTQAFYVIGPNEFYFIDITAADGPSTLFFVNPD